jgi:hypothetical protein
MDVWHVLMRNKQKQNSSNSHSFLSQKCGLKYTFLYALSHETFRIRHSRHPRLIVRLGLFGGLLILPDPVDPVVGVIQMTIPWPFFRSGSEAENKNGMVFFVSLGHGACRCCFMSEKLGFYIIPSGSKYSKVQNHLNSCRRSFWSVFNLLKVTIKPIFFWSFLQ